MVAAARPTSIKGYELIEQIGEGSFGEVWRASQSTVNREVAIKIILPQYANHPDFIRRFQSEAQLVARVEHPFIVPLYDYWRDPSGAYLVMRYFRGGSLRDQLRSGLFPLSLSLQITEQICSALATAHQNGVVHRDLKPANILMDDNQNAYLADFGIAKDLVKSEDDDGFDGAIVGSPAYLSPEQVRSEEITHLADIYSLGIMLYEMLTGDKPFGDRNISKLMLHQLNDPLPNILVKNPDLPPLLNDVIQRATAKTPKNRYPNVLTLSAAFRKASLIDSPSMVASQLTEEEKRRTDSFDATSDETQEFSLSSLEIEQLDPENPYKGLRAFQESDARDFYGRSELVAHLIDRLGQDVPFNRFLAVVGPSGSGKSSAVKAGVIPALRDNALPNSKNWYMVEMVPGAFPFEEIEAALLRIAVNPPPTLLDELKSNKHALGEIVKRILPDDNSELFLLIDQFEEVFTLVEDEARRQLFLDSLIDAITMEGTRMRVVVTIRADFFDKPLSYQRIGSVIRQRNEVVLPLSEAELREAIVAPAERVGLNVSENLTNEIINDVGNQPGALPLLQYALTELYERRDGLNLTLDAYKEIGGVSGALARRAEDLFLNMDDEQQAITRQILLRLVSLGEGTEDTRRRVNQKELLDMRQDTDLIQRMLNIFGKYRLLTFDHDPQTREPTITVAHEALLRRWDRLRDWINDMRDDLRQQARLGAAAAEWNRAGRDSSFLATGTRLDQLMEWSAQTDLLQTEDEADYLKASIHRFEQERRAEEERQAREQQLERSRQRFLQAFAAAMAVGLLVAVALAFLAFRAQNDAEENADRAQQQQRLAEENERESRALALVANARNALSTGNPNDALALSLAAARITDPALPEAERTFAQTAFGPGMVYQMVGHEESVTDVDITPDGALAYSSSQDDTIRVWDLATGEQVAVLDAHDIAATSLAISPDGTRMVSGGHDGTAIVWDLATNEPIYEIESHFDQVNSVNFSPDGSLFITLGGDGRDEDGDGEMDTAARLWDTETGQNIRTFTHLGGVLDGVFTPDGQFIVTTSGGDNGDPLRNDRRGRLWDINTGQLVQRYEGFGGFPRSIDVSSDGSFVAIGSWDQINAGTVRIFDTFSGEETQRIFVSADIITRVIITPDDQSVITASWDNHVRQWSIMTGLQELQLNAHPGDRVQGIALSADGEYILSTGGNFTDDFSQDRTLNPNVHYWDLTTRTQTNIAFGHEDWVWSLALTADGSRVATGSGSLFDDGTDHSIRIWDYESGDELLRMEGHTLTVSGLAWTDDASTIYSVSWDGSVREWDVTSGEETRVIDQRDARARKIDLHPDGSRIIVSFDDGMVFQYSTDTGEVIQSIEAEAEQGIFTVQYHPDGSTFATGSNSGALALWDTATGDKLTEFAGTENRIELLDFSSDGTMIATAGRSASLNLWDVATGQRLREFEGTSGTLTSVAFSPDDLFIASGGSDTTVRIWSVESGEELRIFEGHTDWIDALEFHPDGMRVISTGNDRTIRWWQFARDIEELAQWANENRFIPTISCEVRDDLGMAMDGCEE